MCVYIQKNNQLNLYQGDILYYFILKTYLTSFFKIMKLIATYHLCDMLLNKTTYN